jgi:transposase
MVLLKAEGLPTRMIVPIVGITSEKSINLWIKRYSEFGISGLRNLPGQGRKSILDESNIKLVMESVQKERQRLTKAKEMIEEQMGKRFDLKTLKRFLKNLAVDISE